MLKSSNSILCGRDSLTIAFARARPKKSGRHASLDAIRALAAGLVVATHLEGNGLLPVDWPLLAGAKSGVVLFFVLSGYLLYRPFVIGRVDTRVYAVRRAARILPAYWLMLVGVSILSGDQTFVQQPWTYILFAQNLDYRLWQGFAGVSWTLVIEVAFYLTLPLLALLIAGSPRRLMWIGAGSLVGALAVHSIGHDLTWANWASSFYPLTLWLFVPGMAIAMLEDRLGWMRRREVAVAGAAMLVVGMAAFLWASIDIPTAIAAFLLVGWAVARQPTFGVITPLAASAAAISYAVYLWHAPLLTAYGWLGVPAVLMVASASYLLVERPVLIRAHRWRPPVPVPAIDTRSGSSGVPTAPG